MAQLYHTNNARTQPMIQKFTLMLRGHRSRGLLMCHFLKAIIHLCLLWRNLTLLKGLVSHKHHPIYMRKKQGSSLTLRSGMT